MCVRICMYARVCVCVCVHVCMYVTNIVWGKQMQMPNALGDGWGM